MTILEILFILSIITIVITWIWFVILGFKANKNWGFGILLNPLITPFIFTVRFTRKSRKIIYYYVASLLFFIGLQIYIYTATTNFYFDFANTISSIFQVETSDSEPIEVEAINPDVSIIESKETINLDPVVKAPKIIKPKVKTLPKPKTRSYKTVKLGTASNYLYKKIIITTAHKKHKGILYSSNNNELKIKQKIQGGTIIMGIKRSKILSVKVYF